MKQNEKEIDSNGGRKLTSDSNGVPKVGQKTEFWDNEGCVAPEIMSQGAPENIVGLEAPVGDLITWVKVNSVNHDKNHDILECKGDNKAFDRNKVEKGMNTEVISNISGSVGSISNVVNTNKALRITKDKDGQKGHQRHLSPKLKISRNPRLPGKQPRKIHLTGAATNPWIRFESN